MCCSCGFQRVPTWYGLYRLPVILSEKWRFLTFLVIFLCLAYFPSMRPGRFYFIRLFSECAAHTVSKEYPRNMVCINFGVSCRKDDDFRRFWSISVGLAIFRAVRPADFIFVLIFQICPLGAFLKSRVCVLFNLIVFYLTIFATENKIKMTECIFNTQVFLVAQYMGSLECGWFWKIIITNRVFNQFWWF